MLTSLPVSNGVLPGVYHFDGKARVEEYIRNLGIPAAFFYAGFYMSNLPGQSLRDMGDGNWALAMPNPADAPIPFFDAEADTGKFVKAMFLNHEKVQGKRIYGATAYYTPAQIVDQFKEVFPNTGKKTSFAQLPGDVFKSIMAGTGAPEPIQEALLQNFRLLSEFGYYGGDKLDYSLGVGPVVSPFNDAPADCRTSASDRGANDVEGIREERARVCRTEIENRQWMTVDPHYGLNVIGASQMATRLQMDERERQDVPWQYRRSSNYI